MKYDSYGLITFKQYCRIKRKPEVGERGEAVALEPLDSLAKKYSIIQVPRIFQDLKAKVARPRLRGQVQKLIPLFMGLRLLQKKPVRHDGFSHF